MSPYQQIALWLAAAQRAVVFTGAGISTESGVPDFRSPGGIWATCAPVEYRDFIASEESRREYWRQKSIAHRDYARCQPNAGHRVLASWEARGIIQAVITQNIDEYHQQAGSRQVIELHGTARKIGCLDCAQRFVAEPLVAEYEATGRIPRCPACGSALMKHATISFGQPLDRETLWQATRRSQEADLFLTLGSSLVVHPAASLPQLAQQRGARLVIINRDPTPLDDLADLVLREPLGAALTAIEAALADRADVADLPAPGE
jgi:NAD-dependent deacetylase